MPDIFDEVEEEYRAERVRETLKRYAGIILAAALLVVAVVTGWRVWQWRQARQDQAAATLYMAATAQADTEGPKAALARAESLAEMERLSESAPPGYRTLARLSAAAMLAKDGQLKQALGLWQAIAADGSAEPLLRQLATLLWVRHQIDTGDPQLLASRLKPLTEPGGAWRPLAEEGLALLDLRQKREPAAKQTLRELAQDATAPDGVRQRASLLLLQLGG